MKRQNTEAKRSAKHQQLVERTMRIFSCTQEEAETMLSQPLNQSVRLNPLVQPPETTVVTMKQLGWQGSCNDWCDNGYDIMKGYESLRDSDLAASGALYLQNEASWLPVIMLDPQPHDTILDMCAAPGGKTSHIAAITHNQASITANDNSKPRLLKLQANMARLGANATYTLCDAIKPGGVLEDKLFDKILLDAPCSGEGLINLNAPKTLDTWSVAHIRRLASLQKKLIRRAWQLLRPGGRLVYSTCTMAPEENEAIIDWHLKRQPNARVNQTTPFISAPAVMQWNDKAFHEDLRHVLRLKPEAGREAFFVCALDKQT
jgi:NOL1/NOP2/sun family putative RNA methylase